MTHKNYGQFLYDAVRETLETMTFAEVVPCSFQIGDEEFDVSEAGVMPEIEQEPPVQTDFTSDQSSDQSDSWSAASAAETVEETDPCGTMNGQSVEEADDGWRTPDQEDAWGVAVPTGSETSRGTSSSGRIAPVAGFTMGTNEINFNSLVENQDDWVWSCMRVNSPEIHSVWFVVSKSLAFELAVNMYAGEIHDLNNPVMRDLVAELTNVLGGRLMLLLEKMGGQFTLAVPDIGVGLPTMPDSATMEIVLCKVLVDGEYPVMASICFNKN